MTSSRARACLLACVFLAGLLSSRAFAQETRGGVIAVKDSSTGALVPNIGDDTNDSTRATVVVFPDNEPFNLAQVGASAVVANRCEREEPIWVSITQTANTQLITGTASERIYICSLHLVTATAQNVALVDGTGTTCATGVAGVEGFGGSTAATGWNLAANSGLVLPSGQNPYGRTTTNQDNVCLLQSGAGQVSGGLSYVSMAP
jgi:hypothetical protein